MSNLVHPDPSFDPEDPEDLEYTAEDYEYADQITGVMSLPTM
jgi:hypothetical protein